MAPPIICGRDRPPVQLRPPGGCPGALGSDLHPPGLAGSPGGHRRRQEPGPRPGRRGWTMPAPWRERSLWPETGCGPSPVPSVSVWLGWLLWTRPGMTCSGPALRDRPSTGLTRRTSPPGLPAWCGPPAFCLCRPRGREARSLSCRSRMFPGAPGSTVSGSTPTPRRGAGGRCTRGLGTCPGTPRLFRRGPGPLGGGLLWVRAGPRTPVRGVLPFLPSELGPGAAPLPDLLRRQGASSPGGRAPVRA